MKQALERHVANPKRRETLAQGAGGEDNADWSQAALFGIFLILAGGVLVVARDLVIPVLSAMVLGSMIGPVAEKLQARGVPTPVTAIALVLGLIAAGYGLIAASIGPVTEWIARGPELQALLTQRLQIIERPAAQLRQLIEAIRGLGDPAHPLTVAVAPGDVLAMAADILTPAIGELIVFFATLMFYTADRRRIKHRVAGVFQDREDRLRSLRIFTDIEAELRRHLYVVTTVNCGVGLATAALALAVGLPAFYLFGILAFFLNFAPYIGPAIMVVILGLVSIVTFDHLSQAVVAPAGFVFIATIEGHVLAPSIVGRRLTLRPFVVFLSIAFWTWMWGPIGALLATPILIIALVVLRYVAPKDKGSLPG